MVKTDAKVILKKELLSNLGYKGGQSICAAFNCQNSIDFSLHLS